MLGICKNLDPANSSTVQVVSPKQHTQHVCTFVNLYVN